MKTKDIFELKEHITRKDLANLFSIVDKKQTGWIYNIMRTLHFGDMSQIPIGHFNYYHIRTNDTWPLISYKLYKTTELWWILVKLNNIKNPFVEPTVGKKIRYIKKEKANEVLDTIRSN